MDNYYFSAKAFVTLSSALTSADLFDATALGELAARVKSAEEIAFMRKAAAISEKDCTPAIDRAAPGSARTICGRDFREGDPRRRR